MISEILRRSEDNIMVSSLQNNEKGVSPVIGVILMVAVTVALVALVTVVVFDIGSDVGDSPDATVQFDEKSTTITATVLRNENVDSFKLIAPDGSQIGTTSSIGGTIEDSSKQTGEYQVVSVMPDGSEEVLTSTTVESTTVSPNSYTGDESQVSWLIDTSSELEPTGLDNEVSISNGQATVGTDTASGTAGYQFRDSGSPVDSNVIASESTIEIEVDSVSTSGGDSVSIDLFKIGSGEVASKDITSTGVISVDISTVTDSNADYDLNIATDSSSTVTYNWVTVGDGT